MRACPSCRCIRPSDHSKQATAQAVGGCSSISCAVHTLCSIAVLLVPIASCSPARARVHVATVSSACRTCNTGQHGISNRLVLDQHCQMLLCAARAAATRNVRWRQAHPQLMPHRTANFPVYGFIAVSCWWLGFNESRRRIRSDWQWETYAPACAVPAAAYTCLTPGNMSVSWGCPASANSRTQPLTCGVQTTQSCLCGLAMACGR
jgi:hypothetical protein